jgi:hypothetical protein
VVSKHDHDHDQATAGSHQQDNKGPADAANNQQAPSPTLRVLGAHHVVSGHLVVRSASMALALVGITDQSPTGKRYCGEPRLEVACRPLGTANAGEMVSVVVKPGGELLGHRPSKTGSEPSGCAFRRLMTIGHCRPGPPRLVDGSRTDRPGSWRKYSPRCYSTAPMAE